MEVGTEEVVLTVEVFTDAEDGVRLGVRSTDVVHDAIAAGFERPGDKIEEIFLGDDPVSAGESFEQHGIEDGARLSVSFRAKATVKEVVAEIIKLNPPGTRWAMQSVVVDPEDASRVKGNVNWRLVGIEVLPESFGDLTVDGNLNLSYNKLTTLPERFGDLTVGGDLDLSDNKLTSLPESFGNLKVSGAVYLESNPVVASRPHFDGLDIFM